MKTDYDILIIGGGMVGASLACALGDSGLRIAVVEAVLLAADTQPSYDERTIALALRSRGPLAGVRGGGGGGGGTASTTAIRRPESPSAQASDAPTMPPPMMRMS